MPGPCAAIALVAALVGGARGARRSRGGRLAARRDTTTIVVREPAPSTGDAAPVVAARPLARQRLPAGADLPHAARAASSPSSRTSRARQGSAGAGLGLRRLRRRDRADERPRDHECRPGPSGSTAPAQQVYVEFSRRRPRHGDGRRLRPLRRRRASSRSTRRRTPSSPIPLGDSSRVVVGQPVAAIGSPFGNVDSLSVGVVSAIRRSIPSLTSRYNLVDAIQTDAPINHGNSGGPLFDARGRVIGINAQIRSSGSASGFEGVGFAVPIDSAQALAAAAAGQRQGRVRLRRDHDREPDAVDRAAPSATRAAAAP